MYNHLSGIFCRIAVVLATVTLVMPSLDANCIGFRRPPANCNSRFCGLRWCPRIPSLRGGALEEEDREAQVLRDMGLGGSSGGSDLEDVYEGSLIDGTLDTAVDSNFTSLLVQAGGQESHEGMDGAHHVTVNYYDLASGGTRNLSQWYPEAPHVTGLWQLGVVVHGREWTFCAHRGVCGEEVGETGYGDAMCSIGVGRTAISPMGLRTILLGLAANYPSHSFDAWNRTSIDFAQDLVLRLTHDRLPRRVTVPIPLYVEDDEMRMSDVARQNITVNVSHFPAELDRDSAFRISDMFRLWGKRLPHKMLLGPQLEPIGPCLPTLEEDYQEPPDGKLFVGMPAESWLLLIRDRATEASRQRMRGYLRAMDMLLSPEQVESAAEIVARLRRQH